MDTKNIFVICPNCKNSNTFDFRNFLDSPVITCPLCKADIMAGKDGISEQLKYFIKDKKFNNAIYLHKVVTGDSLKVSKSYIKNLSNSLGVDMKIRVGYKTLFIVSIIWGFVLTYIVSYFFYPKFVYFIANDLFGMRTRGITLTSYFTASVFYGIVIFVLLLLRRIIKRTKQVKVPEQVIVSDKVKVPEQKDFRGNAF